MINVLIKQGTYRNLPIQNETFELVKEVVEGARGSYITVIGNSNMGQYAGKKVRINIDNITNVEYLNGSYTSPEAVKIESTETDEEAMARIANMFDIVNEMTDATSQAIVNGLIISGPPGVGKSHGVEKTLEKANFDRLLAGKQEKYEIVKGSATAIGLFKTLYLNRHRGYVTVFDDCDNILYDEQSLNLLKAALDSKEIRKLSWLAESRALANEDIPNHFDFKGSIIFLTNINFESTRSPKLKPHLDAMMSRCHYIDLEISSMRDQLLRIRQVVRDGMLDEHSLDTEEKAEVLNYIIDNAPRLKELSLRMVSKIADLSVAFKQGALKRHWKELAEMTCLKRGL